MTAEYINRPSGPDGQRHSEEFIMKRQSVVAICGLAPKLGRRIKWVLAVAVACLQPMVAMAQSVDDNNLCGNPFSNHFGPFDYRSADQATKNLVEKAHFTRGVETMTQPATTTVAAMAGDVGYTLRVFPNHHRALITMMRLGERHKTDLPPSAFFTVDCYFERAIRFRPDDTVARLLYVRYLTKLKRDELVKYHILLAQKYAGDNAMSNYNVGLVAFETGEFETALAQANRAKELGDPRPELEQQLRKAGRWRDVSKTGSEDSPPAAPLVNPKTN